MTALLLFIYKEYFEVIKQVNIWQEVSSRYHKTLQDLQEVCRYSKPVVKKHVVPTSQMKHTEVEPAREQVVQSSKTQKSKKTKKNPSKPKPDRKTSVAAYTHDINFIWPVRKDKFWLSSYFGPRKLPSGRTQFHNGIDMAALKGTPVRAAADGIADRVYEDPRGYGKTIILKHNDTYKTRYAHLNAMFITQGQRVAQGHIIGHVGSTGNVRKSGRDASHLHFEVYVNEKRVNPLSFFK